MTVDGDRGKGSNRIVTWLGVATAIVLGLVALLEATGRLEATIKKLLPAQLPIPDFPQYDSPEVGGGHTAEEMCRAQRDIYASQNPDFVVTTREVPATIHKDFLGHVTYVFHCKFPATRK